MKQILKFTLVFALLVFSVGLFGQDSTFTAPVPSLDSTTIAHFENVKAELEWFAKFFENLPGGKEGLVLLFSFILALHKTF